MQDPKERVPHKLRKRRRVRMVIPAYPAFNIYSRIARVTTALGPISVATTVHEVEGWDVEVIDEVSDGSITMAIFRSLFPTNR